MGTERLQARALLRGGQEISVLGVGHLALDQHLLAHGLNVGDEVLLKGGQGRGLGLSLGISLLQLLRAGEEAVEP